MPHASVNGTRLHYHVTGDGMPIVFVHPPLLNLEVFNYQKAQLADKYKVITFDIRGHGHSHYSDAKVTYPLIAEDIKQLLDFLEIDEAVVCGYSTGAGIAMEAMLTHPERFAGGVFISGFSETSDWYNKGRIKLASGLSKLKAKRLLSGAIGWTNSDMNITFHNVYKGAVNGDSRNIRQYYQESHKYSCTDQLDEIKQPVLLLYGKDDEKYHRYARILDDRLPNSDLIFIEGVAHQIPTKAPRTMNRLLSQWMERHFGEREHDSRWVNFVQDVPDFRPDADTPTAKESMQEI
jgi:pimeloyl-ACP methyl ester carboxylesterase